MERYLADVARGSLITIEGLDGAGKSTLASALLEALRAEGRRVELLREPGGVELSERIRALVKDPALSVGARAEALLYAAARAQLVQERVEPLLAQGVTVLLDRYVDSSLNQGRQCRCCFRVTAAPASAWSQHVVDLLRSIDAD